MKLFLLLMAILTFSGLWYLRRARASRATSPARHPAKARQPAPRHAARPAAAPAAVAAPMTPPAPPAASAAPDSPAPPSMEDAELPELLHGFEMLDLEDLPELEREDLLVTLAHMSLPPRATRDLLSPAFLADAATKEFTELVMREPLLSAKIIGRVNSAFYGLSTPIVSVSHAITYMGLTAVRNMALQFTLEQAFASEDPDLQAFHARLFDAGAIAAELSTLFAPKLGIRDVGAASTQAVLSFLGDFAMPGLLPQKSAIDHWPLGLLERTCNEQITLGVNASIAGQLLMRAWEMPHTLSAELRSVHRLLVEPPQESHAENKVKIALSYAAGRVAEGIALGRIHEPGQVSTELARRPECYHLRDMMRAPPLDRLASLADGPGSRLAIARLIAASERSRSAERAAA